MGLFLQYISGTKQKSFWDPNNKDVENNRTMEFKLREIMEHETWDIDIAKQKMANFEKYLREVLVMIEGIKQESGFEAGKRCSPAVLRNLAHFSIWRKNTNKPVGIVQEVIQKWFQLQMDIYGKESALNSRFEWEFKEGQRRVYTLHTDRLAHLFMFAHDAGFNLQENRQRQLPKPGYNASHVKAYAKHGEGEVIHESAIINRGRGTKDIPDR